MRLRILYVINSLAKGGAERLALDICRELRRRGDHDYLLVSLSEVNDYKNYSEGLPVKTLSAKISLKVSGVKSESGSFEEVIKEFGPNVIHAHLFFADHVAHLHPHSDVVYFSHIHGPTSQYERMNFRNLFKKKKLIFYATRYHILNQYRKCHHYFIANSYDTEKYLIKHLPSERKNIFTLPNAIDLSEFHYLQRSPESPAIKLISIGSLVSRKNHFFLLDVVQNLKTRFRKSVHLNILGEGILRSELEKKIEQLELKNEITLIGNTTEVEHYLHQSQVYIHSATNEPFGLSIVEAMATGLPTVCLDGGGNRELIYEGVNGHILSVNDPVLFAEKILDIVKQGDSYQSFSMEARRTAESHDIKTYVDQLLTLYEKGMASL